VQVARHRAGGADDHVARLADAVDDADDLALCGQRPVTQAVRALDRRVPFRSERPGAVGVIGVGAPVGERGAQRLEGGAGVADERERRVLVRVDGGDVEVDEADVVGGENRPRGGGEVAVAGADADDDVGLAGERVGRGRAGRADGADGLRVVVGQ
jgi:hypothetical protein